VELEVNGQTMGRVAATPPFVESITIGLAGFSPTISPDGRAVAYGAGSGLIYVIYRDGSVRAVTQPGYDSLFGLRFSPDGSRMLFVANDSSRGFNHLYVFDFATGASTPVETSSAVVTAAEWAPEGTRIAFVEYPVPGYQYRLMLQDQSTGGTTLLQDSAGSKGYDSPAWSPDGTRIAYAVNVYGTGEQRIHIYELSTGLDTEVDAGQAQQASWSVDGSRLAYLKDVGGQGRVAVRELASGDTTLIGDGIATYMGRFDPTGRWLAYVVDTNDAPEGFRRRLAVRTLDGSAETLFVRPVPGGSESPDFGFIEWTRDGYLAFSSGYRAALAPSFGSFAFAGVPLTAGENLLVARAIVVPEELPGPDSETVHISVPAEQFPDFVPTSLTVAPLVPLVGQPAVLSAQVQNLGGVPASGVGVEVTVRNAAGTVVLRTNAVLAEVAGGETAVVSVPWTPSVAGSYRLRVLVDGTDGIRESREDNNEASLAFAVTASGGLAAEIQSDRAAYPANTTALVIVRLTQADTQPYQGTVETRVEDSGGVLVATLDSRQLSLDYGQRREIQLSWPIGTTYADDYHFRVVASDAQGATVAAAQRSFAILPDLQVTARLVADRGSFRQGETATFAARVENRGTNAPLAGYAARLRIVPDGGSAPVFESQIALPAVLPGGAWQASLSWPAAGAPGAYHAGLDVLVPGQGPLASASAAFLVGEASGLTGQVTLDPSDVTAGGNVSAQLTITNQSASARPSLPVAAAILDGASGQIVGRQATTVDLAAGETRTLSLGLATSGLAPSAAYLVVLEAGEPALVLDAANLWVHGLLVPPSLDAPADGSKVATLTPSLSVNDGIAPDGAPLTYAFEVFSDAALSQPVAAVEGIAETSQRTAWVVSQALQEDLVYYWHARASDGFSVSAWTPVVSFQIDSENFVPLAPVADTPVPGQRVATNQPGLSVLNANDQEFDPLSYEFRLASDVGMTSIVASATGVPQGSGVTTWPVPLVLDENTTYYWDARARDGAGDDRASPWSATASFFVDTVNESPSAPAPLRPSCDVDVTTLSPELAAGLASDPERDTLTYRFELDNVPSFDSPGRQASAELAQGLTETLWTPPQPLSDNTLYYWRVRASDGHTVSPWVTSCFFVNQANDAPSGPSLVDPVGDRPVPTPTPTLRLRNATDVDRDPLSYEFRVLDDQANVVAAISGVPSGVDETEWSVTPPLAEDTFFSWSARAFDGKVYGPWSPSGRFRVNAVSEPPSAPSCVVAPPEGGVVVIPHPALIVCSATSPDGLTLSYEFELYVSGPSGTTLVEAASGLTEGAGGHVSWSPVAELANGSYAWRARAFDGSNLGPWLATAHFSVMVDAPPAAPGGLVAVAGDSQVTLGWSASPEPDVAGYRVYRSLVSGKDHVLIGETTMPAFVDLGLTNGTAYFYRVTAFDDHSESERSLEVGATPQAVVTELPAEIQLAPATLNGGCLLRDRIDARVAGTIGAGCSSEDCPHWLRVRIELPRDVPPSAIQLSSVRLAGAVSPDPNSHAIQDRDGDGIPELELRFELKRVAPLLVTGANALAVTGQANGAPFRGTANVQVGPVPVGLQLLPRTLKRRAPAPDLQAELSFCGVGAAEVALASLRLNGTVPVKRILLVRGSRLVVTFDRQAVLAAVPNGEHVEMRVTGLLRGLVFRGTDHLRVID
jgi:Tol biopolymer transport system component